MKKPCFLCAHPVKEPKDILCSACSEQEKRGGNSDHKEMVNKYYYGKVKK